MIRTLDDLIAELEVLREELGEEASKCAVRIAVQPSWPLKHTLAAVALESDRASGKRILWLAASEAAPWDESPYAPSQAWEGGEFEVESEGEPEGVR